MNLKEIKELIKIIDSSGLTEFHYEKEDIKLTLKKEIVIQQMSVPKQSNNVSQTVIAETTDLAIAASEGTKGIAEEENIHIIKSPIVGVFYASGNPDAPIFVKPGDKVKSGQILCIVEAMKLMNEIASDVDGELLEVLVNNQGAVEYGQPLFKIRKA